MLQEAVQYGCCLFRCLLSSCGVLAFGRNFPPQALHAGTRVSKEVLWHDAVQGERSMAWLSHTQLRESTAERSILTSCWDKLLYWLYEVNWGYIIIWYNYYSIVYIWRHEIWMFQSSRSGLRTQESSWSLRPSQSTGFVANKASQSHGQTAACRTVFDLGCESVVNDHCSINCNCAYFTRECTKHYQTIHISKLLAREVHKTLCWGNQPGAFRTPSVLHGVASLWHHLLNIVLCTNDSIPDLGQKCLVTCHGQKEKKRPANTLPQASIMQMINIPTEHAWTNIV